MVLEKGEQVGAYTIIDQLGQGGMATVYKAYHDALDRNVAIKVMHQAFNEQSNFLERFQREARIVARLEHAHIVPVYDFSQHKGQPYLVMKFVEGRTLKAVLAERTLALREIAQMLVPIADALSFAHERGILHRDIKPSNIMIDDDDKPYITDFGLARIAQMGESTLSQDAMLGTPHYISPEQAQGMKDLDQRTDLYSLGIVLYELVVGRVPFMADTPFAVVHDHIFTPLPMPSDTNPDVPPQIELVLLRALAKEREDRYESARALSDAFTNAVNQIEDPTRSVALPVQPSTPQPTPSTETIQPAAAQPPGTYRVEYGSTPVAAPTPTGAYPYAQIEENEHGHWWMLGGMIALIGICLLSVVIVLSAAQDIPEFNLRFTPPPPEQALNEIAFEQPNPQNLDEQIARSEQALADEPHSVYQHFQHALFLMAAEDGEGAISQIAEALWLSRDQSANPETLRTMLAAAKAAVDAGYRPPAVVIATNALDIGFNIPQVRESSGEALYLYARSASARDLLALRQMRDLIPENPIQNAFMARIYLTLENRLLMWREINKVIDTDDGSLPEVQLIYGEVLAFRGEETSAREKWEFARFAQKAPQWVKVRAAELLASP